MGYEFRGRAELSGAPDPEIGIRWRNGDTGNRLDCETAVLLRTYIRPVFDRVSSWTELLDELSLKGFGLGFRNGRLMLTDLSTGEKICTGRFLGVPLADLAARFGRPCVKPTGGSSGTLIC